jgi:DNA repair photolyase
MNVVYHPKGKAGEYADWALNLYTGCPHSCIYCYAPTVTHKTREEFRNVQPRRGIIESLKRDLRALEYQKMLGNSIFLCFSCDPYPSVIDTGITRQSIGEIHAYGQNVMILTKGGIRAERDFDLLTDKDQFGVTLTCLDKLESLKWEPGAALPIDRMISLKQAKYHGIKTWVSLEPVLNPAISLEIIRQTHTYVDMYKVGILNYHPLTQVIRWPKFGRDVVALLDSLGKKYYIKKDLQDYLTEVTNGKY